MTGAVFTGFFLRLEVVFFWRSRFSFLSYSLSVFLLRSKYTTGWLAFIDVMQMQRVLSETYQQDKVTH